MDRLTDAESPETSFHRLLIVRDVWHPGVQRWAKEYVGRNMPGELLATDRRFATEFRWDDRPRAEREMHLAEAYLHSSHGTPWRIIRAKVTVHRRLRQGLPKDEDFARSPGLLNIQQWVGAVGHHKKTPPPS